MPKYKFFIQSGIDIVVEADNEIEARFDILNHLNQYADEMMEDPYISDGEVIN